MTSLESADAREAEQLAIGAGPLATTAAVLVVLDMHAPEVLETDGGRYVLCATCLDDPHPCPTRLLITVQLAAGQR